MNWKRVFVLVLIILMIMITVFFFKYNSPLTSIEDDLISYFENEINLSLEVGDINCWPLNRLIVSDLKLKKGNTLLISIPEVKMYYNITKLLAEPKKWADSLTCISINKPSVIVRNYDFSQNSEQNLSELTTYLRGIRVDINKGHISVVDDKNKFNLNNINACLERDLLSIETQAVFNKILYSGYNINDLEINNLLFNFNLAKSEWQGTAKSNYLDLAALTDVLPLDENIIIKGNGQALVKFKGFKSKLKDYEGEIEIDNGELNFKKPDYINTGKINNVSGVVNFHSKNENLQFNNFNFTYNNNYYSFSGLINFTPDQVPKIKGQVTADSLELSHIGITADELNKLDLAGEAQLNLLLKGKLTSPELSMDIYLPRGRLRGEIITHFKTHIRYSNDFFYVDSLNLQLNRDNLFTLSGVYNTDKKIYSFNFNGKDIDAGLMDKYFTEKLPVNKLDGKLKFNLILNGKGLDFADMNANGKMEILSPQIGYNNYKKVTAKVWLADRIVMMDNGLLNFEKGEIDFSGQVNLVDNSIDINVKGKKLDIGLINNYIKNDIQITGNTLNFEGKLGNTIKSPKLDIDLSITEGKMKNIEFENLTAHTVYDESRLYVNELKFDSYNSHIQGSAAINLSTDSSDISADLNITDIKCSKIYDIINEPLPLQGNVSRVDLFIRGSLADPLIGGTANSEELSFSINENNFTITDTTLSFNWQKDRPLLIKELSAEQDNAFLSADGSISEDNLDLNFTVSKFNLNNIDFKEVKYLDKDINARVNISGNITGDIYSPAVNGNININNIDIQGQKLQDCKGKFTYCDEILKMEEFIWNTGKGRYIISGLINNILRENPCIDIRIVTEKGDLNQILNLINYQLPLQQEYQIDGDIQIRGNINELNTLLNLEARGVDNKDNYINLEGEIGKKYDLKFRGENVEVTNIYEISPDIELDIMTDVNISGYVKGTADNLNISMKTTASNAKINDISIDKISGSVELIAGEDLKLNQLVSINGSELGIDGDITLDNNPAVDLNINTRKFPLSIIAGTFLPQFNLDGYLDGELNVSGYIDDLTADGEFYLAGKDIELGLPAKMNYLTGKIIFEDKDIKLLDFEGYYDGKPVNISGVLYPFARENFWNLKLTAKDLRFDSGSIDGSFDPNLSVSGPFKQPQICGDLLTHDLIIKIPFKFQEEAAEGVLEPELDIILKPGKDIYIRNQYMDILVEEGSLRLTNEDGKFYLEGKVSSRQGSFDYYNNKFIMERGYATFRKFNDNIPEIWASAYTYVNGIKIYININGPADNMLMTFYSQPELSRKEIINLLVSKGGLGELTSESGASLPDFLKKEFARFFQETFQLEFIENVEEKIKEIFELDRMEIDTYQLGFNEDISVYLGKKFNEKFYLQYSRTFSLDDTVNYQKPENELSFYYYLNNKTHLEGSWLGDDDFRISIETELKF